VILVTRDRTIRTGSDTDFTRAREQFGRQGYIKLAGMIAAPFLGDLLDAVDRATFDARVHAGIGVELCAAAGGLTGALELAFNDPVLLALAGQLTGCQSLRCFEGRVYRMIGGTEHHDSWHSDVGEDRLLAMSLNLARVPADGGLLQIRRAGSAEVLSEVANPIPGDAVLFRIDPALRHRVGPVAVGVRTAYAGWFRSQPDYAVLLRERLTKGSHERES
jgi:hypothetical protein